MFADTLINDSDSSGSPSVFYELPPFLLASVRDTCALWILPSGARTSCLRDTRSFTCSMAPADKATSLQSIEKDPRPLTVRVHKSLLQTPDFQTEPSLDSPPIEFHDSALRNLIEIIGTSLSSSPDDNYTLVCMIQMLCARFCELRAHHGPRMSRRFEDWQLSLIRDVLNSDSEELVSVPQIAGLCRLSVCHFSRLFRATFGMPLHRYMVRERIRRAMTRLSDSPDPIAQIALDSGFADQSTFTRRFTAITGMPPALWRRHSTQFGIQIDALPAAATIC